jgi:hypothetical protein
MPTKKIPISFNKKDQEKLARLISLMDIKGFGDIPKAVKFGITYTLERLERDIEVIPHLEELETGFWMSSVTKLKKEKNRLDAIAKLSKVSD